MSWLSNNYEKAALGGAAIAAIGFTTLGWVKVGAMQACFCAITHGPGSSSSAVATAERIPAAVAPPARRVAWPQATAAGRRVDLFTSVPLFIDRRQPDHPVDLLTSGPILPPIPNAWWVSNHLTPEFGDSPSRDPDGDGFSNLEEFTGRTDPNNPADHPPFIDKLKFHEDHSIKWVVRPEVAEATAVAGMQADACSFMYFDNRNGTLMLRNRQRIGVMPGELFFSQGDDASVRRFKYLGTIQRRVMNPNLNQQVMVTFARIEDQKANKIGRIYEKPCGSLGGGLDRIAEWDRSAIVSLEAGGAGGKTDTIEENTYFGLPLDSPDKSYLMKKITPESLEVEYSDAGVKKTITIRKGAFPDKSR